ncbi:MAG: hypothetical protein AAGH87_06195 [Pseudomonadota bacterium]
MFTDRDHDSFAWSLDFAARTFAGAMDRFAPSGRVAPHLMRGVWVAACRELYYLERFLRRLLVVLAARQGVEPVAPGAPARQAPDTPLKPQRQRCQNAGPSKGAERTFAVADRHMSHAAIASKLATQPWVAGRRCDMAWPVGDRPLSAGPNTAMTPAPPIVDARALAARFAALSAVLADPEPHAERLARMMARRRFPLRLAMPPALARGRGLDMMRSAYLEVERLAVVALDWIAVKRMGLASPARGQPPPGPRPADLPSAQGAAEPATGPPGDPPQ